MQKRNRKRFFKKIKKIHIWKIWKVNQKFDTCFMSLLMTSLWSHFWKFGKKSFSVPFLHFSQNYWFVPIFCTKLPPRTKISIAPLFFVLHGFQASHFEAQYQSNKMAKTDFLLKVKNGRQITPNLTNEKLCQAKWPIFRHFFSGF